MREHSRQLRTLERRDVVLAQLPLVPQTVSFFGAIASSSLEDIRLLLKSGFPPNTAVVSITTAGRGERGPSFPKDAPLLRLRFSDLVEPNPTLPKAVLFNAGHARKILRFVSLLPPEITQLIVHCRHGESRSPAVVAALLRLRGEDDTHPFTVADPNEHVYATILRSAIGEHF